MGITSGVEMGDIEQFMNDFLLSQMNTGNLAVEMLQNLSML